jgi:murein DD-endopeptidase MepM/ murein hydrolase activator NlpD
MAALSARVFLALGLAAVAVLGAGAGAAGPATDPSTADPAMARSLALRVALPGSIAASTATAVAPPVSAPLATASFAYPATTPVVTAGSTSASATAEGSTSATATSGVTGLVLFGGEITADSVLGRAAASGGATGDFDGTTVQNLVVFGAPATGTQIQLADWGVLTLSSLGVERSTTGPASYRGVVTALSIRLTLDHGGLPAGTTIDVGYAEAVAHAEPPPVVEPQTVSTPTTSTLPEPKPSTVPTETEAAPAETAPAPTTETETRVEPEPEPTTTEELPPKPRPLPEPEPPPGLFPLPEELQPTLDGGPYVFPVFGESSYVDTYGAARADVSYHHGADIFGELGQPVVAVSDGTAFSVGWNKVGGNRLWVRDRRGNAFYYAHLSAFSTLVFNGAHVRVGQVVGFMGNTGDADATPPHLHFEVHPVSLLYLGYDGAVDPNPYLDDWRHLLRLPYPVPPGWAPSITGGNAAPQPGAVLLDVADISSADGLDPASLQRAIEASQARP